MRYVAAGLGVGTLILLAGCNTFGFLKPEQQTRGGGPLTEPPSKEALVDYLNKNSERVQTLRCNDLDLMCTMGAVVAPLRGNMVCQRPRNFRLSANHWSVTEVDIGSNNEEFWYWLRRGDPYQIRCTYKDLNDGKVRKLPFPFQPEWVIETLGLGTYGPADRYEYDTRDPETLRLIERTTSPQGTPVRKVIVFRRRAVPEQSREPQVTDYLLLDDATGKEICAAHITQKQIDRNTNAFLPYRVDMRWPEMKLRMTMKFDGVAVNANVPAAAFQRQPLSGVPGFDLATMRPDGSLQRAQGFAR